MDSILKKIKLITLEIVKNSPIPSFYNDYIDIVSKSENFFSTDPEIKMIRNEISDILCRNLGHGYGHAKKVAIDTGVLFFVETGRAGLNLSMEYIFRLSHIAGLLHDICRKEPEHAKAGAEYAETYLKKIIADEDIISSIAYSIENHEAFTEYSHDFPGKEAGLLSACLYDSDKFRWGPDNFEFMIWAMIEDLNISAEQFIKGYKRGVGSLEKIRNTFRTCTGQQYGPEFIDIGLEIGDKLYRRIHDEFELYCE